MSKKDNHKRCYDQNRHKTCPSRRPSEDLQTVSNCLRNREVVIIGGKPNQEAAKRIEESLGVQLTWVATRGTESYRRFQNVVERPAVVVVILAIKWVRHVHNKVKIYCKNSQKAFVHLPRGYNPNQIAYQIRKQCGKSLDC